MRRRARLVRARLDYEGGLVLHTATSGPLPHLDEIRLLVEEGEHLAALGATRINIAYLTGLDPHEIERAVLGAARALDWALPWSELVPTLDRLWPDLLAPARMLFEMAAVDGQAREAGLSLAAWLGAATPATTSSTNQTLFWQDDGSLLQLAQAYVDRGFRDLKLRIGVAGFSDDLRRLRLLRERFGAEVRLSVDANGRWTIAEAPARLEALGEFGLDYVEQPLPPDAWAETAAVSRDSPIPIMLDEALDSMEAVRRLADTGAAPLGHLKLAKLGGLDRLVEATRTLETAGIDVMVGQMNEGSVSTVAAAHAAIAVDAPYRELYGADGIRGEVAGPAVRYDAGLIRLPEGPGIGLPAYPIDDSAAVLWDSNA